uniref:Uncharacterized protein n=1 Tax=Leviviridae sp. TaxID=2027243 RepID=A0A514D088_9VIRU|nr:MAG: hypothetical protein H1RhizoLitter1496_000002 [Leviviridae sp.]
MALGDTLTITLGGSGGTAKVLKKINQDGYSSEYYLPEASSAFRAKVRHTKESVKQGQVPYERHNVEFTETVYASGSVPEFVRQAYVVIRHKVGDTAATVSDLGEGLSFYLNETLYGKLIGWES